MRLWHKDLIPVLPKKQLVSQWRECCAIASRINKNGSPNHILVNKVMEYPIEHLYLYGMKVRKEMLKRGYKCEYINFTRYFNFLSSEYEYDDIFSGWHNDRYLKQCLYNLQEKYDCGGITEEEWSKINTYKEI